MTAIRARSIAIIGAGPSGLAAAKYFLAEKAFSKIVLFEQRAQVGGIWNYTPDQRSEPLFTVPQTDPKGRIEEPVWKQLGGSSFDEKNKISSFVSPVYDRLETNIPRSLMGFSDLNWPQTAHLFPTHPTVLKYIQSYGEPVAHLVFLQTQVLNVEAVNDDFTGGWTVTTLDLPSGAKKDEEFDAVVVANGHFITPYIPDIPGIDEWNQKFPGAITHSKYFRTPEEYTDKRVIVVGNSASGLDISTQLAPYTASPLFWSSKSPSHLSPSPSPLKCELPPISRFTTSNRGVVFEDGRIAANIDAVVFATGYFYSLPFLNNVKPCVIGDGTHVQHTYKHLFYAPRPTLAFLTLPQRIIPFPIAEAQSAVLARVYSGRLCLPSFDEMCKWEENTISEMGNGRNFHFLPFPNDGNYINEMSSWALSAERRDGLENDGQGKCPPVWGEWEFWCREHFPAIRRAFGELGEERKNIRTLGDLGGFDFEKDKMQKHDAEGKLI